MKRGSRSRILRSASIALVNDAWSIYEILRSGCCDSPGRGGFRSVCPGAGAKRRTLHPRSFHHRVQRREVFHLRHRRRRSDVRRRLDVARRSATPRRRSRSDVIKIGDRYYMAYARGGGGMSGGHANNVYVMWTKSLDPSSPDFKFNDETVVASSDGVEDCDALDPAFLLDPTTGRLWLSYGTYFGY